MKRTPLKRGTTQLKRTGFKQKANPGLKRAPRVKNGAPGIARKPKLKTPGKLKKELWELCKQIVRKRHGNNCFTCSAVNLVGSNWHTAHFIASSVCGGYLRYDLRNLRPGCFRCNITLSGNGAVYYRNLVEKEGQEYVDQLFKDKERIIKLDRIFLQSKIDEYTIILKGLATNT